MEANKKTKEITNCRKNEKLGRKGNIIIEHYMIQL